MKKIQTNTQLKPFSSFPRWKGAWVGAVSGKGFTPPPERIVGMVLQQREWELPLMPGVKLGRHKSPKRVNLVHNRDPRLRCVQCVGLCEDTFSLMFFSLTICHPRQLTRQRFSLDNINGGVFPCSFYNRLVLCFSPPFRFLLAPGPKLLTSYTHAHFFCTCWGRCRTMRSV